MVDDAHEKLNGLVILKVTLVNAPVILKRTGDTGRTLCVFLSWCCILSRLLRQLEVPRYRLEHHTPEGALL